MDMSLSNLWEMMTDWEACGAAVHGVTKSQIQLSDFTSLSVQFSSVLSCVQLSVTQWITAHQASLSITNSQRLLKLISIASEMPSNYLILCCPLLLPPSIFPSIRVLEEVAINPYHRAANGTPLQYSCLENPVDGGAWKAAVHGVAEGQT